MSSIIIGKAENHNVALDLNVMLTTRLLVTADSGGGKTFLLKRLCEQAASKIQIIIVDPEGEFSPLREKFPFVMAGKGGETPADVRSAAKLAVTLLATRASAVCDLYEMKSSERHAWVRTFLDALIEAPKNLRHPCLVIVDEAHMFCPEHGKGESEASDSMKSLCTRGRKRLLCAIFATQRLAELDKGASSMLMNRLVGPTFEDVNRKRAAEMLSIASEDVFEFKKKIQLLEPGNFYALGRAITKEMKLVKVGPIETPHGDEARKYELEPPPPPEKIRALLPKLSDLPAAAEQEARTVADFKKQIRELKAQIRSAPVNKTLTTVNKTLHPDPRVIERAVNTATKQYRDALTQQTKAFRIIADYLERSSIVAQREAARALPKVSGEELSSGAPIPREIQKGDAVPLSATTATERHPRPITPKPDVEVSLKAGARRMLAILAQWHPEPKTRDELGALAGFSASGGTFGDYLSKLRLAGYIHENGNGISITDEGLSSVGHIPDRPESTEALVSMWKSKFKAGVGRMLDVLVSQYPNAITREQLGEESGFTASGGTFGEYLSQLRRARLIDEPAGQVKAAESLFP